MLIGVGGCVASQEGEAITARAPFVDLVFGPQTIHRLAEMIAERRSHDAVGTQGRAVVDVSFPEIEKFDRLPEPLAVGARAFVSVMEGCSKYCSFCVVPYTRGDEVSRPFDSVLTEVRALAAQGVAEITLLGQNVNAYAGPMSDGAMVDLATLIHHVAAVSGRAARALHHFASAALHRQPDRGVRQCAASSPTTCTCRCRVARIGCWR